MWFAGNIMSDADDDQSELSKFENSVLDILSDSGNKLNPNGDSNQELLSSGNHLQSVSGSFSGSEKSNASKLHSVGNIGRTNI